MFNYEWQREFKSKYRQVQQALNAKWEGKQTEENSIKAVTALKQTCEEWLQEDMDEREEAIYMRYREY